METKRINKTGVKKAEEMEVEVVECGSNARRGHSLSAGKKRKTPDNSGSVSEYESVDELNELHAVRVRMRKHAFAEANKVTKTASEFILGCVKEYENIIVRLMNKNERLQGRLDECDKCMEQSAICKPGVTFASMVSTSVNEKGMLKQTTSMSDSMSVKNKSYAVVVKAKDESAKMMSEQVKVKVIDQECEWYAECACESSAENAER